MTPLVTKDFQVPAGLQTNRFRLRMLTIGDVVKDYDAVMTSIDHLQNTKPFGPDHLWPTQKLTFEQDLIDLGWHQKEFQRRSSFAYTVMSPDEHECLGCVYIYPSSCAGFDAEIILWVRQSEAESGLDEELFSAVKRWIGDCWPFKNPRFPGRTVDWTDWNAQK